MMVTSNKTIEKNSKSASITDMTVVISDGQNKTIEQEQVGMGCNENKEEQTRTNPFQEQKQETTKAGQRER